MKENQPELLHEAERCTQASPTEVQDEPGREIQYWHSPDLDWPVADRRVQVVKTVRLEQQRRVKVREKEGHRSKGKTAVAQFSTNFYATNFELGSISPLFIHQLSRSRWRIDTEVFQTLTTDCHLKHPAVHQTTALVVLTMIRFLAYTLSLVFYHRQVCSHARRKCDTFHELAKRFAYMKRHTEPSASANINYKSDGLQEPGYSKTSHLTNLSTESRGRTAATTLLLNFTSSAKLTIGFSLVSCWMAILD